MLTQATGYAATALGCIASMGGAPILIKEIAEACHIPAPYLAKIVNMLARKGLVSTQRGVGGGVTLGREPTKLTLYDLCIALDDPIVQRRCMLGTADCTDERACPAHQFWTGQRARQVAFLQETTVAEIAAFETRRLLRQKQPVPLTQSGQAAAANGGGAGDAPAGTMHETAGPN